MSRLLAKKGVTLLLLSVAFGVLIAGAFFGYRYFSYISREVQCVYCEEYLRFEQGAYKSLTLFGAHGLRQPRHRYRVCVHHPKFPDSFALFEESCRRNLDDGDFTSTFAPGAIGEGFNVEITSLSNPQSKQPLRAQVISFNQSGKDVPPDGQSGLFLPGGD